MDTTRREILGASLGLGLLGARSVLAQSPPVPVRKGKIVQLFKSPEGYPNAIAEAPEGW